ncbi:MAG: hypothetical protein INR69_02735 [Mucilaginibacter polytrichastri]|nr:hypothetical protein [Mucilaginibacter polytrichastri]
MKLQELNQQELVEINGGDSSYGGQFGLGLGLDNLLSFSNHSKDGDDSRSTSLSVLNGLGLNVVGGFAGSND